MIKWFSEFMDSLPAWGKVAVIIWLICLMAFAIWMGRDLSPIWGVLD